MVGLRIFTMATWRCRRRADKKNGSTRLEGKPRTKVKTSSSTDRVQTLLVAILPLTWIEYPFQASRAHHRFTPSWNRVIYFQGAFHTHGEGRGGSKREGIYSSKSVSEPRRVSPKPFSVCANPSRLDFVQRTMFQLKYLIAGFYWTIFASGLLHRNARARVGHRLAEDAGSYMFQDLATRGFCSLPHSEYLPL